MKPDTNTYRVTFAPVMAKDSVQDHCTLSIEASEFTSYSDRVEFHGAQDRCTLSIQASGFTSYPDRVEFHGASAQDHCTLSIEASGFTSYPDRVEFHTGDVVTATVWSPISCVLVQT